MSVNSDVLPLLPDPPPYHKISANEYRVPKHGDFNGPPPYAATHGTPSGRFRIPQGSDIYWSSIFVYGPERKPVSFRDKYLRRQPAKRKKILHKVSGVAKAGRLLAIMGSSGAGKSTLLNVLTFRNLTGLTVQGSVVVDGRQVNKWKIREISAFVQQNDMFVGTMTVHEHLRFMAKLRMGSHYTKMEQELRVDDVIRKMGLSGCTDTMIGIPGSVKGLSRGEMKRLSFASEILTCPRILFCDEPTSGLDAFMAGHVVTALRALADGGMTIALTIHQPSSQVYSLFNDVCLMACGRIIYLGPTEEANPLFERCGYPCPDYCSPADHLIRTLAIINGQQSTCLETVSKVRQGFLKTSYGKHILEITNNQKITNRPSDASSTTERNHSFFHSSHPASFLEQVSALTWRSWLTTMRDPAVLYILLIQTIVCAVTTGFVYFATPVTSETIISVNGILFNNIRNLNFMLQFPAVPAITMELPIVMRENSNGVYTATAYFVGKNIAELPKYVLLPTIYNVIVYWMSGLFPNVWTFLFATLICSLMTNVAISISYAVATIFGTTEVAMTLLPIFVVPMLAFGGFFITYDAIPVYFKWLSALSYFKYGYEALAINEWEMIDLIPGCENSTFDYWNCPRNGAEVLEQIDFDGISKWTDVLILSVMLVVIRLISYVALLIRVYRNH